MIVLITGANRGIGFGIVEAIVKRIPGATILIGCRALESGGEAIGKLRKSGVETTLDAIKIDVEDDAIIAAAAKVVEEKYGKVDVLINNAAQMSFASSSALADARSTLNKNVNNAVSSQAIVTRAFIPLLRHSDFPRVIMVSSARGSLEMTAKKTLPPVQLVDYCVCKSALNMLTLHFQQSEDVDETIQKKITYWMVSPGFTKTGFNNFRGTKDPVDSAEVVMRLLESKAGEIAPGTFWEFEQGAFRAVPW